MRPGDHNRSLGQPVSIDNVRPATVAQIHPAGDIKTALRRLVESAPGAGGEQS
mgnify:CR=1 FL=1